MGWEVENPEDKVEGRQEEEVQKCRLEARQAERIELGPISPGK